MAIKQDFHHQDWLIPPRIEERVPDDHICYLIRNVLESMSFDEFELKHKGRSRPAFHPVVLLGILILGLTEKIHSSRKLAEKTHTDLAYMYVAGKLTPDFRTIARFRKNNKETIEDCFQQIVKIANELGMIRLGELSIDGSKVKANASKNKNLTKDELAFINKLIREELEKGIKIDEAEDELFGKDNDGYSMPKGAREQLKKLINEQLEKEDLKVINRGHINKLARDYLEGDENKKDQINEKIKDALKKVEDENMDVINLTDPDSHLMKNKKKFIENSYNTQITVEAEEKIIIANDVVEDAIDTNQLQPQIEAAEKNVGPLPEDVKISSDNGYSSPANLKYSADRNLDTYIPDKHLASMMNGHYRWIANPFHKVNMPYDPELDIFICPAGIELHLTYDYDLGNGLTKTIYTTPACKNCALSGACFKSGSRRMITCTGDEKLLRAMRAKLTSKEGAEVYGRRKSTVEAPFGTIKQHLGLREFSTRGRSGVKNEWNLACATYNLKRIGSFLKKKFKEVKGSINFRTMDVKSLMVQVGS